MAGGDQTTQHIHRRQPSLDHAWFYAPDQPVQVPNKSERETSEVSQLVQLNSAILQGEAMDACSAERDMYVQSLADLFGSEHSKLAFGATSFQRGNQVQDSFIP